jgi:hypothetical protein
MKLKDKTRDIDIFQNREYIIYHNISWFTNPMQYEFSENILRKCKNVK